MLENAKHCNDMCNDIVKHARNSRACLNAKNMLLKLISNKDAENVKK